MAWIMRGRMNQPYRHSLWFRSSWCFENTFQSTRQWSFGALCGTTCSSVSLDGTAGHAGLMLGVSQRDGNYYRHLQEEDSQDEIAETIRAFWEDEIRGVYAGGLDCACRHISQALF